MIFIANKIDKDLEAFKELVKQYRDSGGVLTYLLINELRDKSFSLMQMGVSWKTLNNILEGKNSQ